MLQAQFSNSLLLFAERGAFAYPGAPTGVAIAKALKTGGPLVTSIDVSVSNSVKTTVKMDLYTSRFGKLQKQQADNINAIARQKQRIIDQTNDQIRRGLAKGQSNNNMLGGLLKNGGQAIMDAARESNNFLTAVERNDRNTVDTFVASYVEIDNGVRPEKGFTGRATKESQLLEDASLYQGDIEVNSALQKTAGASVSELYKPYSHSPSEYMPNFEDHNKSSIDLSTGHGNIV